MKKVILHRLATTKRALDACKLVEALFLEGKKVLVAFSEAGRAATFNEYLWTFSQSSFVPHSLWDGQGEADDPVVLALGTLDRPNGATVLVVVDPLSELGDAGAFSEIHDFVTPAPEDQDKGDRWAAAGFEVQLGR
ncbi:MAG: DNA polymerase III subunit chi [Thermoanaerobaculaceae bacterium]|nr:DNA polymerase III subunit chi [Thermoanaerobaculaceae bacterium]